MRYRFEDVLIDLTTREIHRGTEVVGVEARVFDLIALLLVHRDRTLSKRELNETIWSGRPVTDAALSQQLRKARRALGDDGGTQRVIRTMHGHGLRWVAPIEIDAMDQSGAEHDSSASPAPIEGSTSPISRQTDVRSGILSRRSVRPALAALALLLLFALGAGLRHSLRAAGTAATGTRIAVLPVVDRTGEADLAWTRAGLMGLMTSLFEQKGGVDVVPAETVRTVLGPDVAAAATAMPALKRSLGVSHVISAELRRLGPLYELDLDLTAADGVVRHDVLHGSNPASLAADAVARAMRWFDRDSPAVPSIGIANPFLAEAYARGLDAQLRGDAADATHYFSICIDRDPGLGWPRLGLSIAQSRTGNDADSLANAKQVLASARELGDNELRVAALRQLASLAFHRGDLDAAETDLDEALAHLPETGRRLALVDVLVAYGSVEDERGERARAEEHFRRALALARDTGSARSEASVLVNMASVEDGAGEVAAAAASLRAAVDAARKAGDAQLEGASLANLGATEANQGHLLDGIALLKQAVHLAHSRGDADQQMLAASRLGWTLVPFGRLDSVKTLAQQMLAVALREHNPYQEAEARWLLAGLAERRHDWPAALDGYERAHRLYAAAGMVRSAAPALGDAVAAAAEAGDAARARSLADEFRSLTRDAGDAAAWQARRPLIEAQLRKAGGDEAGAADDLSHALDLERGRTGPVAQDMLFQLGRWQVELGRGADLLARPEWRPLLADHPDAIKLHIAALRETGRGDEADAEQRRLDLLTKAPALDLDPSWVALH